MALVQAEVDPLDVLSDIGDDDLLAEVERRNLTTNSTVLTNIWMKRRRGIDYQRELDDLIYLGIGKIV